MKAYKFFKLKARLAQAVDIVGKAVEEISEVVTVAAKEIVEAEKAVEKVVEEVKESVKEVAPVIQPVLQEVKTLKKKKNEQPTE